MIINLFNSNFKNINNKAVTNVTISPNFKGADLAVKNNEILIKDVFEKGHYLPPPE